ncbi:MAG: hypothetical protein WCS01_01920 [bacterium]
MKRILLIGLIGFSLPVGAALALPNGAVVGVVAGTAAGLIVANNVHGVNPWVAAPVGALMGGYLGSRYAHHEDYRNARNDRYGDRDDRYPRRYHYAPAYHHARGPYYHPEQVTRVIYVEKPVEKKSNLTPETDLQPGVDLIKVSILNSNGIRTDIPILRVKGKFVGPQGEAYETLPTAEQLTRKYGM